METLERKPIAFKQTNSKFQKFFTKWKEGREESRKETFERVKTPEYQNMLNKLKTENAKRGISTPGRIL
jgi:hypothetical protein